MSEREKKSQTRSQELPFIELPRFWLNRLYNEPFVGKQHTLLEKLNDGKTGEVDGHRVYSSHVSVTSAGGQ